jgi:predicted dehydrogenase
MAAELDGEIQLVCGAFSSDPEKSRSAGAAMHLDPARAYGSYAEMIEKEGALPADRRMDFVTIATPNHLHAEPALLAMRGGFDVVIDKPLCFSLDEARSLQQAVEQTGRLLAVTYTYSGYPLVKEIRALVAAGRIGAVRKVYVEYPQGWLASDLERSGNKQADWRTDPSRSGAGGAIGDIGTHAAHLAEYTTGLKITAINAELKTTVAGRRLDDDVSMLLRFDNGASGVLSATQVAVGEENNLKIRIYGEKGGVDWQQVEPNSLVLSWPDKPREIFRTGWGYLGAAAQANTRTPPGHPEGYLEAFANVYTAFAKALRAQQRGERVDSNDYDFPGVADGVRGMAFIDCAIRSSRASEKWTQMS